MLNGSLSVLYSSGSLLLTTGLPKLGAILRVLSTHGDDDDDDDEPGCEDVSAISDGHSWRSHTCSI